MQYQLSVIDIMLYCRCHCIFCPCGVMLEFSISVRFLLFNKTCTTAKVWRSSSFKVYFPGDVSVEVVADVAAVLVVSWLLQSSTMNQTEGLVSSIWLPISITNWDWNESPFFIKLLLTWISNSPSFILLYMISISHLSLFSTLSRKSFSSVPWVIVLSRCLALMFLGGIIWRTDCGSLKTILTVAFTLLHTCLGVISLNTQGGPESSHVGSIAASHSTAMQTQQRQKYSKRDRKLHFPIVDSCFMTFVCRDKVFTINMILILTWISRCYA